MTSLSELLSDMSKLQTQLSRFETQFGVKSQDFYAAMNRGDLEEFGARRLSDGHCRMASSVQDLVEPGQETSGVRRYNRN